MLTASDTVWRAASCERLPLSSLRENARFDVISGQLAMQNSIARGRRDLVLTDGGRDDAASGQPPTGAPIRR
jgi:hypothetical protein